MLSINYSVTFFIYMYIFYRGLESILVSEGDCREGVWKWLFVDFD